MLRRLSTRLIQSDYQAEGDGGSYTLLDCDDVPEPTIIILYTDGQPYFEAYTRTVTDCSESVVSLAQNRNIACLR